MQTTAEALSQGFVKKDHLWSFTFGGTHEEYELCFEDCICDGQMYVALYKRGRLLTNKVVVKPGYVNKEKDNAI